MGKQFYPTASRTKIFFIPYAGGSRYSYFPFSNRKTDSVDVITVELPGRGTRYKDALQTDIHLIVDDLIDQIKNDLDSHYAIFGHSMGALVAFLLSRKLLSLNLSIPSHLFLSGCKSPNAMGVGDKRYLLPREEFINEVVRIDGDKGNIFRDERILEVFEPILRADIEAIDTYNHHHTVPLPIQFNVFAGTEDLIEDHELTSWRDNTIFPIDLVKLSGGHFFIFDHVEKIMSTIEAKVQKQGSYF